MKTLTIPTGMVVFVAVVLISIGFLLGLLSVQPGLNQIKQGTQRIMEVESRRAVERTYFTRDHPEFYQKFVKSDRQAFKTLLLGKDPKRDRTEFLSGGSDILVGVLAVQKPWIVIYPGLPDGQEVADLLQDKMELELPD